MEKKKKEFGLWRWRDSVVFVGEESKRGRKEKKKVGEETSLLSFDV